MCTYGQGSATAFKDFLRFELVEKITDRFQIQDVNLINMMLAELLTLVAATVQNQIGQKIVLLCWRQMPYVQIG